MTQLGLKPCPFCGDGGAKLTCVVGRPEVWVECPACGATSGKYVWGGDAEAEEAWNARVDNPTPPAA